MMRKIVNHLISCILEDENAMDIPSFSLRELDVSAHILLKQRNVVISGIDVVKEVLKHFNITFTSYFMDGTFLTDKTPIRLAKLNGRAYDILITERTILNVLSIMSGVATKVKKIVDLIDGRVRIAATRKTFPGLGVLQKLAVVHGGGDPHRFNLSDCYMIKDNHLKLYGTISRAVEAVKKMCSFTKKVEIEVEDEDSAMEALKAGADIIMLDNFEPSRAKKLACKLKAIKPDIIVEFSGGITEDNIREYLCDCVDIISLGCITMGFQPVDYSLEIDI